TPPSAWRASPCCCSALAWRRRAPVLRGSGRTAPCRRWREGTSTAPGLWRDTRAATTTWRATCVCGASTPPTSSSCASTSRARWTGRGGRTSLTASICRP
ncbi:hypothetical protein NHX12_032883, partial [Muraenolepis orangiensis]